MKLARPGLAAVALLALAGCSSRGNNYAQVGQAIRIAVSSAFGRHAVSMKEAAAIPYASMGWRLNGGPENIIVLATDSGKEQLWTSGAHIVLLAQDGRIRRTVGLPQDVGALASASSSDLLSPGAALQGPYSDRRIMDLAGQFAVPLTCRVQARGRQAIAILGKSIATRRIDESCTGSTIGWTFVNSYWVDAESGFVWRTRQHLDPGGEIIDTEIFRPPG